MVNLKIWSKKMSDFERVTRFILDPDWRIANLYSIVDQRGNKIPFRMNWAQKELYQNLWYCSIVLKARQLGISTFVSLLFLDRCLFNSNCSAGIICHTREDSERLFNRVKFSYDALPEEFKSLRPATTDSARELVFTNGSALRVGTSMRGQSLNYLHISEFGKICSRYPEKAREVITGSLNTVAAGQHVIIESTAEGRDGAFFDLVNRARALQESGTKLTPLDYRFFFFPWWKAPEYNLRDSVPIPQEIAKYFEELEAKGIGLYPNQKFWYVKKQETQNTDMMREYPSTPDEAFHTSLEGAYYSRQMLEVRRERRVGHIPYDPCTLVHTSWDLGYGDSTSIWFYQIVGKELHFIEYYESSGEPLTFYLKYLQDRPYQYGRHSVPHDARVTEFSTGHTRIEVARKLGVSFTVVPNISIDEGIDAVRHILRRCWFDEEKCSLGIKALEGYRRSWNDTQGCWSSKPHHDHFSHGADAFRMMAVGVGRVERSGQPTDSRTLGHADLRPQMGSQYSGSKPVYMDMIDSKDVFRGSYPSNRTSSF